MKRKKLGLIAKYTILFLVTILTIIPMYLIIIMAFKPGKEIFSATYLLPTLKPTLENFSVVFRAAPFLRYLINTIIVVSSNLLLQILVIIPAAYAFARLSFRGSSILFGLFIVQIMLPIEALLVPNYQVVKSLGLFDKLPALIMPFIASGYGTFLLRQVFKQVPKDLEDAAIIDGCGHIRFIWHVLIPLARPTITTFSLVSVATRWNDYAWPLIITDSPRVRTLSIGLGMFVQQESGADWGVLMAATLFISFPIVLFFLILQRTFLESFMTSGLKG